MTNAGARLVIGHWGFVGHWGLVIGTSRSVPHPIPLRASTGERGPDAQFPPTMSELLPAANAAPSHDPSGAEPARPPAGPLLRVMCFNVRYGTADDGPNRWEHRSDLAVRTIRRFDPDLLGVQEALRFQADALCAALDDYGFAGAGRDDGRDAGEFCGV